MTLYNRIMVAVDFSTYSLNAVNHGASLARRLNADLILINVLNQRDVEAVERVLVGHLEFRVEHYILQQREERARRLREMLSEIGAADLPVKIVVEVGVPYLVLLDQIDAEKADLLIMSTKGRSNLVDTVIGSCAQKMYRRCPVPLLSLRPEKTLNLKSQS